jgi:hypothetical protein
MDDGLYLGPCAPGLVTCNSCGHQAPGDEMKPELKFDWTPTGNLVCRSADACFERWLANERKAGR